MPTRKSSIASIEGLRALSIAAVIGFHFWPQTLSGGFLGVDLFFVISGYVITGMLAHQLRLTGSIDFRYFYQARVRRLAPAMAAVVGITIAASALFAPDATRRAIRDSFFIFTGTYNWRLSGSDISYFDMWSPPLLQHLWSLSIETQFYMIWPLILWALSWKWSSKKISRGLLIFAAGLALLYLKQDALSVASLSGNYFHTHSHLVSLLLGSALGLIWRPENFAQSISKKAVLALDVVAGLAIIGLVATFSFSSETSGEKVFALTAILGALVVMTAIHPTNHLGAFLGSRPLVLVGQRSYSLYLWHWPIGLLVPKSALHGVISLAFTIAASEITYRWIEQPFRLRRVRWTYPQVKVRWVPVLPATLLFAGIVIAQVVTPPTLAPAQGSVSKPAPEPSSSASPTPTKVASNPSVFIGDSVLLGIRSALPATLNIRLFDGVVGRQANQLLDVLTKVDPALLDGTAVINLGNNGRLTHDQTVAILDRLSSFHEAIVVNVRVPRQWQDPNNELIARLVPMYPNIRLVDWYAISEGHPEYLGRDQVHLTPAGAAAYVEAIQNP